MAKKGQTAKHRKQLKKEKANRAENKQQQVVQQVKEGTVTEPTHTPEEPKPMSPARRAFQDV